MSKNTFIIKIREKGFIFESSYNRERFKEYVREHQGTRMRLEPVSPHVSDEARGFYFGGVINGTIKRLSGFEGMSTDEVHELLKREFNGVEIRDPVTGNNTRLGKSIAINSSRRFQEYLLRIGDWLMENYGQSMPDPEDYKSWRDSAPLAGEEYNKKQDG